MKLLIVLLTAGALTFGCSVKSEPAKTVTPTKTTATETKAVETNTEDAPKVATADAVTLKVEGMT